MATVANAVTTCVSVTEDGMFCAFFFVFVANSFFLLFLYIFFSFSFFHLLFSFCFFPFFFFFTIVANAMVTCVSVAVEGIICAFFFLTYSELFFSFSFLFFLWLSGSTLVLPT